MIGEDSWVRAGLFITTPGNLYMGNGSKIGPRSELYLYDHLRIGDNVEIGSGLIVHTGEHNISDPDRPLAKQGSSFAPVQIGNDVYIGSRVTILKNVTVSDRVAIAAGSVVNKDLTGGWLYAGVPVKPIKKLNDGINSDDGSA